MGEFPAEAHHGIEVAFLKVLRGRNPGVRVSALRDDDDTPAENAAATADPDVSEAAA